MGICLTEELLDVIAKNGAPGAIVVDNWWSS